MLLDSRGAIWIPKTLGDNVDAISIRLLVNKVRRNPREVGPRCFGVLAKRQLQHLGSLCDDVSRAAPLRFVALLDLLVDDDLMTVIRIRLNK